jgi:AhpD family alkylhydroperoxidase
MELDDEGETGLPPSVTRRHEGDERAAYFRHDCGLDRALLELVKLRASQINGCGHCIDMHVKELRTMGEGEQRLHLLNAWEESPFSSDRERAALT